MVGMKKLLYLVICFFAVFPFYGQQEVFFSQANDLYNQGEYNKSIELYEKILKGGNHSADLYFNLANALYKTQQVGPSIYYYEKALKLSPDDKDILNNYAFAKQNRIDEIETLPKGVMTRFYEKLVSYSPDFWGYFSIVSIVVFVLGFILFYISVNPAYRKLFFGGWVLGLILGVLTLVLAFSARSYQKNHIYGIVFSDEVLVRSEPNLRGETLFKLHEGTRVQYKETVEDWQKVELLDGKTGWVTSKSLKML